MSLDVKRQAISRLSQGRDIDEVCEEFSVPKKNLIRWQTRGPERKSGGGRRKIDNDLEGNLYNWCYTEGIRICRPVTRAEIREKALELCAHPEKFRASKGWIDKFVKKHKLRKVVTNELKATGRYRVKNPAETPIPFMGQNNDSVGAFFQMPDDFSLSYKPMEEFQPKLESFLTKDESMQPKMEKIEDGANMNPEPISSEEESGCSSSLPPAPSCKRELTGKSIRPIVKALTSTHKHFGVSKSKKIHKSDIYLD